MNLIIAAFSVAFILVVWFKTEAFVEYCKLFPPAYYFFYIDKYLYYLERDLNELKKGEIKKLNFSNYIEYIEYQWSTHFFGKLLTCPICVGTWLSLFASFFVGVQYWLAIAFIAVPSYILVAKLIDNYHK